jgi:hypothetical protein
VHGDGAASSGFEQQILVVDGAPGRRHDDGGARHGRWRLWVLDEHDVELVDKRVDLLVRARLEVRARLLLIAGVFELAFELLLLERA